jgi:sulfate adenylyltransferase
VDQADLVLTAEASHRTRLLEERPAAFRKTFTLGQFAASARAADPSLRGRELISALSNRRVPASPDHDIDDPYRRGPDAAHRAAVAMDDLLGVVVDRLRRTPQTGDAT